MRLAIAIPSWLRSAAGTLSATAASQRLMKTDATEPTSGLSPASMRRSMPRMIRLGRREVLLAREQERHVDRDAGEDRLLDRGQAFLRAGNLDEQVGTPPARANRSLAAASVLAVS